MNERQLASAQREERAKLVDMSVGVMGEDCLGRCTSEREITA